MDGVDKETRSEPKLGPNMKDTELIEIENEEPSKKFDVSLEAESTGTENGGQKIKDKEKDNGEEEEDVTNQRWQIAKVGIFDIGLYSADVVTDGVQVATHISNCHVIWATLTAVFMILPAFTDSIGFLIGGSLRWVAKDYKFRLPFSTLSFAFFSALFTLLAHEIFPDDDHWVSEIIRGIFMGFAVIVVTMFFVNTANTLKGYAVLMAKKPSDDGSVSDPKMLDGIKGKLKEVLLEAAPQSNLQVRFRKY